MNNNKLIVGVVIAVVIVVVILLVGKGGSQPVASSSPTTSSIVSTAPTTSVRPTASSGSASLSYTNALTKYAGTRFQFDAQCQAIPSQRVIKTGATIMLDNRSGDARTIGVGTTKYYVAGYGFKLVTLTAKTFPTTLLIDCGTAQNVGKIIIEK